MELQELGLSEAVAQRLLTYQVQERWLTGGASVFEQRVMDVAAGAGYCEDHGGGDGCFLKGQALKYVSDSVTAIAFGLIGTTQLKAGTSSVDLNRSVDDIVIRTTSAGESVIVIQGKEMSIHSAQQATNRNISTDNINNAMKQQPSSTSKMVRPWMDIMIQPQMFLWVLVTELPLLFAREIPVHTSIT